MKADARGLPVTTASDEAISAINHFAHELVSQGGALALEPDTMWAQHCLAHVWAGQSRISEGISSLQRYSDSWRKFSQYIQSHNWFHLATLYLSNLSFDSVFDAYRKRIWGFQPDAIVEQTDAIVLLWYVELAGGAAGPRWRAIAPHLRDNVREPGRCAPS